MMADVTVRFTFEGRDLAIDVPEHWTLDRLLRERVHVSGVRRDCGIGRCDACTVLVDEEPTASCLMLAVHAEGRHVSLDPARRGVVPALEFARSLSVAVVRSPHAAARIVGINTHAARATPGVVAVVTARDVPNNEPIAGWNVLAADRVIHVGQAVALVAADSPDAAALGANRVAVDYEPTPSVLDAASAIQPDAPAIVTGDTNVAGEWNVDHGSNSRSGEPVSIERLYRLSSPASEHARADRAAAWVEGDGVVVANGACGNGDLARMLGIPYNRVRRTGPAAAGSAESAFHAAFVAWRTGRPAVVDAVELRAGSAALYCRTAADSSGRLLSHDVQLLIDVGAPGPRPIGEPSSAIGGPYVVPHTRLRARAAHTHTAPAHCDLASAWFTLAIESQLDRLAHRLGIDPLALRLRNLAPEHAAAVQECCAAAIEALGKRPEPSAAGTRVGRGLVLAVHPLVLDTAPAFASVTVEADGSITVRVASRCDCPALAAIATAELGVPASEVVVRKVEPPAGRTNGSWLAVGHAVQGAARELQRGASGEASCEYAPEMLQCAAIAAHAADVEVDSETGVVRVLRHVACHELGFVLASESAATAIRRETLAGIRFALPTATDVDLAIRTLQMGGGPGPDGARPIGTTAFGAAAAAAVAAVHDASEVTIDRLPLQWEDVV
jgi:CO/xanthine dehydrogenase Mo-binding subunit